MYEPNSVTLAIVKSRISPEFWQARVEKALRSEKAMRKVAKRVAQGVSLNEAIRKAVPPHRRSWVIRNWKAYQREGFEALMDLRTPREPELSRACEAIIQAARQTDPKVTADRVLEILRSQRLKDLPSRSTIWKHFARVDGRAHYAEKKQPVAEKVEHLQYAGGELMRAAELETGAIAALTDGVKALAEEAERASRGRTPARDVAYRNELGHFTGTYNRKRRRKRGEQIASYLRSAEEKAEGRVPSWPRFVHERRETLEPKLAMMAYAPLVTGTKGWNALRASEAAGLLHLRDGAWVRLFLETGRPWHLRGKELLKKLASQKRLVMAKPAGTQPPACDADWCNEALASHGIQPLTGIVATDATALPHAGTAVVSAVGKLANAAWWTARSPSLRLNRALIDYECALELALRHANSLMLVDPYIDPTDRHQYGDLLRILAKLQHRSVKPLVEIHRAAWYGAGNDKRPKVPDVVAALLPGLTATAKTTGTSFEVFLWDDIHDRYLVTDLIGISLPHGFGTTTARNAVTTWTRLGRTDRDSVQRDFDPAHRAPRHRFKVLA